MVVLKKHDNQTKALIFTLLIEFSFLNVPEGGSIPGHLQPLGSHQAAEGYMKEIQGFPEPSIFFREFVNKSRAVLFKGAGKDFKATSLWDDKYLRNHYGNVTVSVDRSKKENRNKSALSMKLRQFLNIYKREDVYMIDTLPIEMRKDLEIPRAISCDGFLDRFQDLVMWFSSGDSKSHLHIDSVENINCMISGSKDWFLVDKDNSEKVILDREEGDYSSVDVDAVDMLKYAFLRELPWWNATVEEGDCLYVPYGWAHQVSSTKRNIAVNFWWTPTDHINISDCANNEKRSLTDLKFSYAEHFRFLLAQFSSTQEKPIDFEVIHHNIVSEHTGRKVVSNEDFRLIDKNGNGIVEPSEVSLLTSEELNEIFDGLEPGTVNIKGKSMGAEDNEESIGDKVEQVRDKENDRIKPAKTSIRTEL